MAEGESRVAREPGTHPGRGALKRPVAMHIDLEACIECGACDDLAPGVRDHPERIAVTTATLEAMAVCPVGAILWSEGETHEQDA